MSRAPETLPVIFRMAKSGEFQFEVTAVFPTLPGDSRTHSVTCCETVGQHSTCGHDWYVTTRAATPAEYAPLLRELQGIYEQGDDAVTLKPASRWTRHHDDARRAELTRSRRAAA